ncbi:MAG: hypothetical protein H7A48_07100 [Akkermansiaceae bacterium]|nr:hypothetical protein [Akkermansiaceae bacterium]
MRILRSILRRLPGPAMAAGLAAGLVSACATYEQSMLPGSAASLAQDRIMMVRKSPPTFGYDRLLDNCRNHPDLGVFVNREGVPDFLAETRSHGRQYLILYYLSRREAFACRTESGRGRGVEFSGPYPVTPREFKVLDDFRKRNSG